MPPGKLGTAAAASGEVTLLLAGRMCDQPDALQRLMPLVYRGLRRIAARQMRAERAGQTLQPTALVHGAFLRLRAVKRGTPVTISEEILPSGASPSRIEEILALDEVLARLVGLAPHQAQAWIRPQLRAETKL